LGYYTGSDPLVEIFYWIGVVSLAISLFLILQIIVIRLLFMQYQQYKKKTLVMWRTLLLNSLCEGEKHYPAMNARAASIVIDLWNKLYETISDEEYRQYFINFARETGLMDFSLKQLNKEKLKAKLQAIRAVGNMGLKEAWPQVEKAVNSKITVLSLSAAECLVHLDMVKAIDPLLDLVEDRPDWPRDRVAGLFQTIGADYLSKPMASRMLKMSDDNLARMIRYLELIHEKDALNVLKIRLREGASPDTIAASLYMLGRIPSTKSLAMVRAYCFHPSWIVRNQAAIALGRIGNEEDQKILAKLVRDTNRWVRFRAAQALVNLPTVLLSELKFIAGRVDDPFARDILIQAIAEKEMA